MAAFLCFFFLILIQVKWSVSELYWLVDLCEVPTTLHIVDTFLMLECVELCRNNADCRIFTRENRTCTLYPQPTNDLCHQGVQLLPYFTRQDGDCMNAGYLEGGQCVCVHGFVGNNCSTRMSSCTEGFDSGSYDGIDGVLPIQTPSMESPLFVHCDMINGGRLFIQSHKDSNIDFYRSWDDMAAGFGTLMGDHWLGNQALHHLTSSKNMAITVQYVIANGTTFSRSNTNFKIADEAGKFAIISFSSTSGDLGSDCFTDLIGSQFSSSDTDLDGLNWWACAGEQGASWWFNNCDVVAYNYFVTPALCNPNGPLVSSVNGLKLGIPKEVFWVDFPYAVTETNIWLTDS